MSYESWMNQVQHILLTEHYLQVRDCELTAMLYSMDRTPEQGAQAYYNNWIYKANLYAASLWWKHKANRRASKGEFR